jgi:hypothetical protein
MTGGERDYGQQGGPSKEIGSTAKPAPKSYQEKENGDHHDFGKLSWWQ